MCAGPRSGPGAVLGRAAAAELWAFLQVFTFMTGLFLTDYAVYQFLPAILQGPGELDWSATPSSTCGGQALPLAGMSK